MIFGKRLSRRRREELALMVALTAPAVLIISFVTIYPLVRSFRISLHQWDLTKPNEGHPFVGLGNYQATLRGCG